MLNLRRITTTLSLFLKTTGTSYVLNGLKFWKKISEGKGWKIGSSMLTAQSYIQTKLHKSEYWTSIHLHISMCSVVYICKNSYNTAICSYTFCSKYTIPYYDGQCFFRQQGCILQVDFHKICVQDEKGASMLHWHTPSQKSIDHGSTTIYNNLYVSLSHWKFYMPSLAINKPCTVQLLKLS